MNCVKSQPPIVVIYNVHFNLQKRRKRVFSIFIVLAAKKNHALTETHISDLHFDLLSILTSQEIKL